MEEAGSETGLLLVSLFITWGEKYIFSSLRQLSTWCMGRVAFSPKQKTPCLAFAQDSFFLCEATITCQK